MLVQIQPNKYYVEVAYWKSAESLSMKKHDSEGAGSIPVFDIKPIIP